MHPKRAIEVDKLSYAYPGHIVALDSLCFTIAEGESVGLVGPNGAGKTTLFLCLAGVLRTDTGQVRIGDLNPSDSAHRRLLPTRVGIVFQNSDDQLFQTTLLDDVAFGPLNLGLEAVEVKQRVAEALMRVGMTGCEQRAPHHLSGGEKRRAALAGVLAMRPEILLLDEPTMFLDPRGRREFIRLLHDLPGTRIIAAHDLEMILETCGRVLVLDHGRLIADGPPRELFANAELMEAHGLEVPHSLRHGPAHA